MKTVRLRKQLISFLGNTEGKTFDEILEHINTTTKHGTLSHALANILSKDRRFKLVGTETKIPPEGREIYHSYNVTVWALTKEGNGKKIK